MNDALNQIYAHKCIYDALSLIAVSTRSATNANCKKTKTQNIK